MVARRERRPHQRRVLAVIQVIEDDDGVVAPEIGVPQADVSIDSVVRIGPVAGDGWGLLREQVADRELVVEHYDRTPNLEALATAWAKHALVLRRWYLLGIEAQWGARPPLLLIFCGGRPRSLLAALSWLDERDEQHVWDGGESGVGSVAVVDLVNLDPAIPGASVLKLMRRGRSEAEIATLAAALHNDNELSEDTRERFIQAVANERIPMERRENENLVEYWRRVDRAQGRGEGLSVAVLDVVELRGLELDDAARERIESCDDASTLRRWLQRAVTAERLEDVFDDG